MIDLGFVVNAESRPMTLLRKSAGHYNANGEWTGEVVTPVALASTIQPVSGKDLRDLPEGERKEARYTIWTTTPLSVDENVVYNSELFRVMTVWDRSLDGGFYRAVLGYVSAYV